MPRSRKAWSPRDPYKKELEKFGWDPELWREPDEAEGDQFIWYGPGGPDGEHATVVELKGIPWDEFEYEVTEYTAVEGLIEDPPGAFLKTSVIVDWPLLDTALKFLPPPPDVDLESLEMKQYMARVAAGIGVAKISYWGGEQEFVDNLLE